MAFWVSNCGYEVITCIVYSHRDSYLKVNELTSSSQFRLWVAISANCLAGAETGSVLRFSA